MKIASIQFNSLWEDTQKNLNRIEGFVSTAKDDDCDLLILPEMFSSGFSMSANKIAEPTGGMTSQLLCQLSKRYHINIIAGLVEKTQHVCHNIAITIDRAGRVINKYVKNYPFSLAGEHQHYEAGNIAVVCDVDEVKLSTFICYDLRFPELFRSVAKQVQMMVVIASWPETRIDHWVSLLKARAIENQCFVVGVNRTGSDGNGLQYNGRSLVVDPYGQILSLAGEHSEYQLTQIDICTVQKIRQQLPFLQDMKTVKSH